MPYTLAIPIALGVLNAGLILNAQLIDSDGVDTGAAITTGIVELGEGHYIHEASIPVSHRGAVRYYDSANNTVILAIADINDQRIDLTQTVPTTNTAETVGDALNAARAQGFGSWTIVGDVVTLFASNGTTPVATFQLDDPDEPSARTET